MMQRLRLLGENLRRVFVRILIGTAIVLITGLLLAPEAVGEVMQTIPGVVRLLLAATIVAVTAGTLYYRYRIQGQNAPVEGLVVRSAGTVTGISVESAQEAVHAAILAVPGVISADVDLQERHGKAVIAQSIVIKGDAGSLADQQKAVDQALRKVLHRQLNVRLAEQPVTQIRISSESGVSAAPSVAAPSSSKEVLSTKPAEKPAGPQSATVPAEKPDTEKKPSGPLGGRLLGRRDKSAPQEETGEFWQFLESTAKEPDPEVAEALSVLSGEDKSSVKPTEPAEAPPDEGVEDDKSGSST